MNNFAQRLKELRLQKKLSQKNLAKQIGMTQSGIAKWEAGTRTPSIDALIILANFFDCTINYLAGRED